MIWAVDVSFGIRWRGALLRTSPLRVPILARLPFFLPRQRQQSQRRLGSCRVPRQFRCATFHDGRVVEMSIMNARDSHFDKSEHSVTKRSRWVGALWSGRGNLLFKHTRYGGYYTVARTLATVCGAVSPVSQRNSDLDVQSIAYPIRIQMQSIPIAGANLAAMCHKS